MMADAAGGRLAVGHDLVPSALLTSCSRAPWKAHVSASAPSARHSAATLAALSAASAATAAASAALPPRLAGCDRQLLLLLLLLPCAL
jgi:hypothetical protein